MQQTLFLALQNKEREKKKKMPLQFLVISPRKNSSKRISLHIVPFLIKTGILYFFRNLILPEATKP